MKIGDFAVVKDDVWRKWLEDRDMRYRPCVPMEIVAMPAHSPFQDSVMFGQLLWWWKQTDLETVSKEPAL